MSPDIRRSHKNATVAPPGVRHWCCPVYVWTGSPISCWSCCAQRMVNNWECILNAKTLISRFMSAHWQLDASSGQCFQWMQSCRLTTVDGCSLMEHSRQNMVTDCAKWPSSKLLVSYSCSCCVLWLQFTLIIVVRRILFVVVFQGQCCVLSYKCCCQTLSSSCKQPESND